MGIPSQAKEALPEEQQAQCSIVSSTVEPLQVLAPESASASGDSHNAQDNPRIINTEKQDLRQGTHGYSPHAVEAPKGGVERPLEGGALGREGQLE